MTIKNRISKLEKKSGLKGYKPYLIVIQGQDFNDDDDLEAGIQKKLLEEGYKIDECEIMVVKFVEPKHYENDYNS